VRIIGIFVAASLFTVLFSQANVQVSSQNEQKNAPLKNSNTDTSKPDDSLPTIRTSVREVHLIFTVTDKEGHYLKNLTQNDFKLLDDHKPPEEVSSFRSETDLPLQIGLLIDTSESVKERFEFEQQAAIEFLKETIRPGYDRAFVMGFDASPKVVQDFTDDPQKLSAGVHQLRLGSLTAMYDAVYEACKQKLLTQPQAGPVRHAIVLLSDGNDNASSVSLARTIDMAQRAEVSVFTISTSLTRSGGPGFKNLEKLAEATGGRSYVPMRLAGVTTAFAAIQEGLRCQYAVSYKPAAFTPNGHYRSIDLEVKTQRGLRVHCRKGYRSLESPFSPGQ